MKEGHVEQNHFLDYMESPAGRLLKEYCDKNVCACSEVYRAIEIAFNAGRESAVSTVAPEDAWREVNAERCRHREDARDLRGENKLLREIMHGMIAKSPHEEDNPEPQKPTKNMAAEYFKERTGGDDETDANRDASCYWVQDKDTYVWKTDCGETPGFADIALDGTCMCGKLRREQE